MNKENLKLAPCPFCGEHKVKITTISKGAGKGSYYQGLCNKCWARGPKTSNYEEAAYRWNERLYRCFETPYHVDKKQLQAFIDGKIYLRCKKLTEYLSLLQDCIGTIENIDKLERWWHTWLKYKEDTVASSRSSIVDEEKTWFGYCDTQFYKHTNPSISIEDIIVK